MAQMIPVYTDAFYHIGRLDIVQLIIFFTLKQNRLNRLVDHQCF